MVSKEKILANRCFQFFFIHSLRELVKPGINGLVFSNSEQLTQQILSVCKTSGKGKLESMRNHLMKNRADFSWDKNWNSVVKPIFVN